MTSGLWTPGSVAGGGRGGQLWVPPRVAQLKHRARKRTVTLRNGERAKVTVDDSGHVTQVERAERLDAIVRPDVIRIKVQRYWTRHGPPVPEGPLRGKEGRYAWPPRAARR